MKDKKQKIAAYLMQHEARDVVVAAYGMGTNSTAFIIEMVERGEPIDLILAADTGDEWPETYVYRDMFSNWLVSKGYPPVTTVRKGGRQETLYEDCMRKKMLPSLAYGFKGCSHKYKIEPQNIYVNNWLPALAAWAHGKKVIKLIGYDMDEPHRAAIPHDEKYTYRYPLLEWGWGREECVDRIEQAGLPQPGGSSCFHCPATTKPEIMARVKTHPLHMARAFALELNAADNLGTVQGLGRRFSWVQLYLGNVPIRGGEMPAQPCGACHDGARD